jgi:hypothetical protein
MPRLAGGIGARARIAEVIVPIAGRELIRPPGRRTTSVWARVRSSLSGSYSVTAPTGSVDSSRRPGVVVLEGGGGPFASYEHRI